MVFGDGAFGRWLSALIRKGKRELASFLSVTCQEGTHLQTRKRALLRTELAGPLILDFPETRVVRYKFVLFKPVYSICVIASWTDSDGMNKMGVRQASQNEEIALRELWVSVEGRSGCRGISSKDVLHLVVLLGLLIQSPIIVIEGRKWGRNLCWLSNKPRTFFFVVEWPSVLLVTIVPQHCRNYSVNILISCHQGTTEFINN